MITDSQRVLLELLKASLFGSIPHIPHDIDWDEVVLEAKAQTVYGLVSSLIPKKASEFEHWKVNYIRLLYEQDKILSLFDSVGIPCVVLKGYSSAIYYPTSYLREMGDIDILVPRDRFKESIKLVELNGYNYVFGKDDKGNIPDNVREIAYEKNGVEVEIHHHFSSSGYDIDSILENAILYREYRNLNGFSFPVLPEVENGLVLLGHINQHLKNNLVGLRQIIDWEMYLNSIEDRTTWEKSFVPIAKKNGLLSLARYITQMCIDHLGLPGSFDMCEGINTDLSDELLSVILMDGNFGRRQDPSEQREDRVFRGASYDIRRIGFFRYYQRLGLVKWRLCKKYSFLRPFAFYYGVFRHIKRGVKAIINHRDSIKKMNEGKARYDLYNKIGVIQDEEYPLE